MMQSRGHHEAIRSSSKAPGPEADDVNIEGEVRE